MDWDAHREYCEYCKSWRPLGEIQFYDANSAIGKVWDGMLHEIFFLHSGFRGKELARSSGQKLG